MKNIFSKVTFMAVFTVSSLTSISQVVANSVETDVVISDKKLLKEAKREARKSEISSRSLQQFSADFPGAEQIGTARVGTMDKISFLLNGVQSEAYYDMSSNLIGTITEKTVDDLPKIALKTIGKNYKSYTIGRVLLYDDNEANDSDMTLYGRQFADADNYFVELSRPGKKIIIQVSTSGDVFFFKSL